MFSQFKFKLSIQTGHRLKCIDPVINYFCMSWYFEVKLYEFNYMVKNCYYIIRILKRIMITKFFWFQHSKISL